MDRENWDHFFLRMAGLIATRSRDPSTKVGAVIVNNFHQVVGSGYNGFPRGVHDSEERLNCRETKYQYMVHAEVNACLLAGERARGCTIYVTPTIMHPNSCPECVKVIIQSGIRRLVAFTGEELRSDWQRKGIVSETMLREAGVQIDYIQK